MNENRKRDHLKGPSSTSSVRAWMDVCVVSAWTLLVRVRAENHDEYAMQFLDLSTLIGPLLLLPLLLLLLLQNQTSKDEGDTRLPSSFFDSFFHLIELLTYFSLSLFFLAMLLWQCQSRFVGVVT